MKEIYAIIYIAVLGIVSHFIGNALPRSWFDSDAFPYRCYNWEKGGQIYQKLGVTKWKTRVPDMSKLCGDMRPKTMRIGMSVSDMAALIAETSVAECVHWVLILLSAGILLICPNTFGVVLWLADILLLNLPFIIIQRYNRPKLIRLKEAAQRKQGGAVNTDETSGTIQQQRART